MIKISSMKEEIGSPICSNHYIDLLGKPRTAGLPAFGEKGERGAERKRENRNSPTIV